MLSAPRGFRPKPLVSSRLVKPAQAFFLNFLTHAARDAVVPHAFRNALEIIGLSLPEKQVRYSIKQGLGLKMLLILPTKRGSGQIVFKENVRS
jgi:hypothetical protein